MSGLLKKIRYPKLLLLIATFILAYFIFYNRSYPPFNALLLSLGYIGVFIAGFFYAYGFTAAPATAVLLVIAHQYNVITAALIGGLGALISDLIMFYFIRFTVADELRKLSRTKVVRELEFEEGLLFGHLKKYATAAFAGFLIASPLPTEVGVTMIVAMKRMSPKKFAIIAYLLHTAGILIILTIGNAI
jgi:uncharacterized membrane protein YdjX (TVP38/TMEM64 family)